MKKVFSLVILSALLLASAPEARAADVYANTIVQASLIDLYAPEKALGAPDGGYAEFWDEELSLTLDMGEGEEGEGDLTLYINPLSIGAIVRITFLAADNSTLDTFEDFLPVSNDPWTITYEGAAPYRFVTVESLEDKDWALDAIAASNSVEAEPVDDEPSDEPVSEPEEGGIVGGDLVKIADNPSVYLIGNDGQRHAFPNQTVFDSWGYNFADVTTIDQETLSAYVLGGNVTMKPATHLVKITTNPKVYAVAPDAELRWVVSEEVAIELYGENWAENVVDVADVFWKNYTVGEDIDEASDIEGWDIPDHRY